MRQISPHQTKALQNSVRTKTLLFVGPKPPPIGGSPLTVQAMLEELALYPAIRLLLINTSPALDVRKKMTGFNFEKVRRSLLILPRYFYEILRCDVVLVFANELFAVTLMPVLLLAARLFHKPFYLKPVGAGLDLFIRARSKIVQKYLLCVLRAANGILTQTQLLKDELQKFGITNTHYLPGCRPLRPIYPVQNDGRAGFRIIFLGHITRLKGPLILLDALEFLLQTCDQQVTCDFYGPIHDEIRDEFLQRLASVPNAHYCGVARPGSGPQLISQYDVLVLPTYYDTEGHPGVLIEAMHAGVPVISTRVRTLPELIMSGWNGFLVPTQDSCALAEAIHLLAITPALKERMGRANYLKGLEFRVENVVAELLRIIFPDTALVKE